MYIICANIEINRAWISEFKFEIQITVKTRHHSPVRTQKVRRKKGTDYATMIINHHIDHTLNSHSATQNKRDVMARKTSKKTNAKAKNPSSDAGQQEGGFILADPDRIRFQHSKIRPYFSGCGRSVMETLESIRRKEMKPSDLPPIQVIVGPQTEDGPWYFSLNNRRLWVLKRCREEGLLDKNQIRVRVRSPKSSAEAIRYSLENCALEAKMMKESAPGEKKRDATRTKESDSEAPATPGLDLGEELNPQPLLSLQEDDNADADADDRSDSDESDDAPGYSNPFSALS
jgi:hypothetical protein